MQRADIERDVLNVLADFVDDPANSPTSDDLDLDSFSRLCVLAELEGRFDVTLEDEDIQGVVSVDGLVDVFATALARQVAPQVVVAPQLAPTMGGV